MFPGDVCLERGLSVSSQQDLWEATYGGASVHVPLSVDTAVGLFVLGVYGL